MKQSSEKNRRPVNILWLMSDQHHAGCAGFAGHPDARTPCLDEIAAEGAVYQRAYCNNPICAPSRVTLLCGQHPHTHGVTGNRVYDHDDANVPNVAEHFRHHGYQTAIVGKAHLPRRWVERGFEHIRVCDLADAREDDPLTCDYFRYLREHGLADEFDLGTPRKDSAGWGNRAFTSKIPERHCVERWTGDESVAFLRARDRRRPFFLKVSFQRPHEPLGIPPERAGDYDPDKLSLPGNWREFFEGFAGKPAFQREYVGRARGEGYPYRPRDEADLRRQLAHYLTLVTMIDGEIGRVVRELKQSGEWENTMVVYLADHGDFAGEHGLIFKNLGIYEAIHRIPFIVKWPGAGPRGPRQELVDTTDFAPTLCAAAGLPPLPGAEGRDLGSLLDGLGRTKEFVVCEWDYVGPHQAGVFAVRSASHRLVFYVNTPEDGELYDCTRDPGEVRNLWNDPAHECVKSALLGVALSHVGRFRRSIAFADDPARARNSLTTLIHQRGWRWSDVEKFIVR